MPNPGPTTARAQDASARPATTETHRDESALRGRYETLVEQYGPALMRLASGYERDRELWRDLYQEILLAVWRALPRFEGRSSVRTWLYRIAHNVASTHVAKASRDARVVALDLDAIEHEGDDASALLDARQRLTRLREVIHRLKALDRQIMLLHLEGVPQAEIAEITGLTRDNVSTKVHRIRAFIARRMKGVRA